MKPFRWDIQKREQLGRLTNGERSSAYKGFINELRNCASRIVSFSDNGLLAFVGRSPESLFDYLSGVFEETSKADDLVLLNISNRSESILEIKNQRHFRYKSLKLHFQECSVSPRDILQRKRKTLFTDLVATGGTFGQIASFIFSWANEEALSLTDLRLKIGFIGITWRTKTSPNTWRWQQKNDWVKEHQIRNIKNVSAPGKFWDYLGNKQMKVSNQNPPKAWGSELILEPPREESNLKALRRAYDLYLLGQQEKRLFSNLLSKENAITEAWFRNLISDLRLLSNKRDGADRKS